MPPKERTIVVVGRVAGLTVLTIVVAVLRYTWVGFVAFVVLAPIAAVRRVRHGRRAFPRRGDPPPFRIPPDLDRTAPPELHADGTAACSGCDAIVPFASMSICEDGYFCPGCARAA